MFATAGSSTAITSWSRTRRVLALCRKSARDARVRKVLAEVDGVGSVEVTVDARAEWWPGMMAASARQRLRAVRPL